MEISIIVQWICSWRHVIFCHFDKLCFWPLICWDIFDCLFKSRIGWDPRYIFDYICYNYFFSCKFISISFKIFWRKVIFFHILRLSVWFISKFDIHYCNCPFDFIIKLWSKYCPRISHSFLSFFGLFIFSFICFPEYSKIFSSSWILWSWIWFVDTSEKLCF